MKHLIRILCLLSITAGSAQQDTLIDIRDKKTGKLLERDIAPSDLKNHLDQLVQDIYVEYWYQGKMFRKCWYRKEELIAV